MLQILVNMGLFYKTDGLTSYYTDDDGDVVERSHTTAYTQSGSTLEYTATDIFGVSGGITNNGAGIWFSSDGTKLYIVWTDFEYYDYDSGYMEQFNLSTAWDLSTVNTTPATTLTLPKGTEFPHFPTSGTALYSETTLWTGLEWADDGLSFYFVRNEYDDFVYSVGRGSNAFLCSYTLSSAWNLSTASLSSTTSIAISDIAPSPSFYGGYVSMYHTMSGGELVICMDGDFIQLDSISDTTANFTSSLGSNVSWFFSDDQSLLLGNGTYQCAATHTKIETNYPSGAVVTSISSSIVEPGKFPVCSDSFTQTYYHDGSGVSPAIGDTLYSDDPGVTTLAAGKYRMGTIFVSSQVTCDSSGVVTAVSIC